MKSLRSIKAVQVKFLDGRIGDDAEEKMATIVGWRSDARTDERDSNCHGRGTHHLVGS